MTHTPPEAVTPLRAALLGLLAGAGAALLAMILGWLTVAIATGFRSDDVIGANIGAGLAAMSVILLAAPFLAWPFLRWLRLPHPLLAALLSIPTHIVLFLGSTGLSASAEDWLWDRYPAFAEATSPAVPWFLVEFLVITVSVALPAFLTSGIPRPRRRSRP